MKKILIVEDEINLRQGLRKSLEDQYTVLEAENALHALKIMKKTRPDIILTDIVMPEMEGVEFLINLKKDNNTIPIIIMSGTAIGIMYLEEHNRKMLGAAAALKKPFEIEQLQSLLHLYCPAKI